jgi:methylated-DNA-[protein]-cysteine S-methyltransferase
MITYKSTMDTPAGPFTILADASGAVLAAGWTVDADALSALVHRDLRGETRSRADLGPITAAVRDYLDGHLDAPTVVPVRQYTGGVFLTSAWKTLREVAPGEPVSYAEFAIRTGNPTAIRAAAQACARNAAALFVPCHRVIRSDGTLGGFRWGLDVKRWLLVHEAPR